MSRRAGPPRDGPVPLHARREPRKDNTRHGRSRSRKKTSRGTPDDDRRSRRRRAAAHGLDTVYALPGVHNDEFFDALARNTETIRTVHTRHEQGAAYMALGAALATGKPQAYCVVPGPGLLNSSAALLTAYGMNAPVLAIVGQIPQQDIGAASATCMRSATRPASSRGWSTGRRASARRTRRRG